MLETVLKKKKKTNKKTPPDRQNPRINDKSKAIQTKIKKEAYTYTYQKRKRKKKSICRNKKEESNQINKQICQ